MRCRAGFPASDLGCAALERAVASGARSSPRPAVATVARVRRAPPLAGGERGRDARRTTWRATTPTVSAGTGRQALSATTSPQQCRRTAPPRAVGTVAFRNKRSRRGSGPAAGARATSLHELEERRPPGIASISECPAAAGAGLRARLQIRGSTPNLLDANVSISPGCRPRICTRLSARTSSHSGGAARQDVADAVGWPRSRAGLRDGAGVPGADGEQFDMTARRSGSTRVPSAA
jgi:hypothetical protein